MHHNRLLFWFRFSLSRGKGPVWSIFPLVLNLGSDGRDTVGGVAEGPDGPHVRPRTQQSDGETPGLCEDPGSKGQPRSREGGKTTLRLSPR